MKSVLLVLAGMLVCIIPFTTVAGQVPETGTVEVEHLKASMQSARWTGPMLASNAETLPQGHFYTEPYFFDVISGGKHNPGSSGFYQYGLMEGFTVGVQPSFAFGTSKPNRKPMLGDFKLLSQLRLTHFTPEHRIPTIAIVLQEALPTGKHDRLDPSEDGHGSGSFATEVGLNLQHYFMLKNGRLLRGRINVLKSFPHGADVAGRSVYGTGSGFRGRVEPGSSVTLIGAVEYSITQEWVLAFDAIRVSTSKTKIEGRNGSGPLFEQAIPSSSYIGFAPAVEYNWSAKSGILFGVRFIPRGHNTPSSITPAIAFSQFW